MPKKWPSSNSEYAVQFSFAETRRFRLAVKSAILCYFGAVILKVLLVNLIDALNFADVFKK